MSASHIFMFLCGLGFLLFGMKMLSSGLETIAGDKMQSILRKAASNRFFAVLVGIFATIAINSSTATTIMTVSFVNSGLLTLSQSIGIIMGANVGTTFSTQLIAFGMQALPLMTIAACFIFTGTIMYVFFRNTRVKNIGYVILGFGVVFFAITFMSDVMRPLRENAGLQDILIGFENPILALLAGFIITAIIQSSTATTAILVTLLASGVIIPFQTVAFILLGVNIGTSVTTLISSIPANRESKRAALFHIMYDIIGSIIFGTIIIIFPAILDFFTDTWSGMPAQQAAMFHTIYNVSTMLLLLPFIKQIASLMKKLIPVKDEDTDVVYEKKLLYLDSRLPMTPSVATQNAHMEVCRMGRIANENLEMATDAFLNKDAKKIRKIFENETVIDFLNHKITAQLASINRMTLSPLEANNISKMFLILSNFERIGDHAVNIAEYTETIINGNLSLSKPASKELTTLSNAVNTLTEQALVTFQTQDKKLLQTIREGEKKTDRLTVKYVENHIERLKEEMCNPEIGVIFTAMINDLERSADHAKNIAFSVALERKWNKA